MEFQNESEEGKKNILNRISKLFQLYVNWNSQIQEVQETPTKALIL